MEIFFYRAPPSSPPAAPLIPEEAASESIDSLMDAMWYGHSHNHHPPQSSSSSSSDSSPDSSSDASSSSSPDSSSDASSSSSSSSSLTDSASSASSILAQEEAPLHESWEFASWTDTLQLTASLFAILDRDGDGRVTVDELLCLLQKLSAPDSPPQAGLSKRGPVPSLSRPDSAGSAAYLDLAQFRALYHSLFPQTKAAAAEEAETGGWRRRKSTVSEEERGSVAMAERRRGTESAIARTLTLTLTLTLEEEEEEEWEEDVAEAFRVFDRDGDGFISAGELAMVLQELQLLRGSGAAEAEDTCRGLIGRVDADGDGRLDLREFRAMVLLHG